MAMKLIALICFLSFSTAQAMDVNTYYATQRAMEEMVINRGFNAEGQQVLFAKWKLSSYALGTWHFCSITRVDEALNFNGDMTLKDFVERPIGALHAWKDVPPENINPWCKQ